jgi:hypothetical protein
MNRPGAKHRAWALLTVSVAAPVLGGSLAAAEEPQAASQPWEFSITPYVWGTALKGDVGAGRTNADVDASS